MHTFLTTRCKEDKRGEGGRSEKVETQLDSTDCLKFAVIHSLSCSKCGIWKLFYEHERKNLIVTQTTAKVECDDALKVSRSVRTVSLNQLNGLCDSLCVECVEGSEGQSDKK
jgi:hypothetical protein